MKEFTSNAVKTFKINKAMSKKGTEYVCLVADLGYTRKFLSFNIADIAELLGVGVAELNAMIEEIKVDEFIEVQFA